MNSMPLRDFRAVKAQLLEKLAREVTPLPVEQKHERVERSKKSFTYFAETYFPHYCEQEFAPFHLEMIAAMEERPWLVTPIVRAAPRGFGKSVVVSFLYVIWSVIRRSRKFIVIVSANDDLATDLVSFIRVEFEANQRLIQDYGEMMSGPASDDDFIANGVRVFSRGRKQMQRGFRNREARPDLVILDDIEKDDEASSPVIVGKTLDTIRKGIYPSLAPHSTLMIVGTIIKKRSVLGKLLLTNEEPFSGWNRIVYRSITGEASLWESRWPYRGLLDIRHTIGSVPFESEYQNNPIDDQDALFREEWIRRYDATELNARQLTGAMFIDPSAQGQTKHDYKAIIALVRDRAEMLNFVRYAWIKKASIDAMLHATFRIYGQYRNEIKVVGVEANGFQSLLLRDYERLAKEYGYYLPIRQVTNTMAKTDRIERLSPPVEHGKILFRRQDAANSLGSGDDTELLVEQLLYFPAANVHDDGPDALEGAYRLLDNAGSKPSFEGRRTDESGRILKDYDNYNTHKELRDYPARKRAF